MRSLAAAAFVGVVSSALVPGYLVLGCCIHDMLGDILLVVCQG